MSVRDFHSKVLYCLIPTGYRGGEDIRIIVAPGGKNSQMKNQEEIAKQSKYINNELSSGGRNQRQLLMGCVYVFVCVRESF